METVTDLFSWAPKSLWMVTAAMKLKDGCSLEGKLCKPRQHIKKQRHHFADKRLYNQSYGFSSSHVQMWELDHKEGWELQNWCFSTVMLEKTFESPLDCRRSNQSILKETSPRCSVEGLMLRLKLQCFGHLCKELTHWKRPWCWEGLGAAGEGDDRGWDGWMVSPTRCTWVWVNSGSWWWTGRPGVLRFMGLQRVGHEWATELDWWTKYIYCVCAKLLQLCLTLCDPRDCSLLGFSVLGILQAKILEWVVMPSSRGSSWPRDQTCVS